MSMTDVEKHIDYITSGRLNIKVESLIEDLPELIEKGGGQFGPKRLELIERNNEIYAKVWIGEKCTFSASIFALAPIIN